MAERRMFAKTIIDSDAFLDMPLSTQALYFHLSMRGDDDGFINNPKKIQRMVGASDDDLKLLCAKNFIIPFETGIVVIKHWKIHNYIQKDRYKPTVYTEERERLKLKDNGAYSMDTACIQDVSTSETQVNLIRVNKSIDNNITPGKPDYAGARIEVIKYLNQKTGKDFRHSSKATVKLVESRLKEGYTVDDFKKVIDNKTAEWKGTEQDQYLRPETLFTASHFESYLNQRKVTPITKLKTAPSEQHPYDKDEIRRRAKE